MEKLLQEQKTKGGNNEHIVTGKLTKNIFFSYEAMKIFLPPHGYLSNLVSKPFLGLTLYVNLLQDYLLNR